MKKSLNFLQEGKIGMNMETFPEGKFKNSWKIINGIKLSHGLCEYFYKNGDRRELNYINDKLQPKNTYLALNLKFLYLLNCKFDYTKRHIKP